MKNTKNFPSNDSDFMVYISQEQLYKAKDLGVSARTIYHWKTEGLLFNIHENEEKNKMLKFSLAEYCWIKVIQSCRSYGLSMSDLKTIKHQLIEIVHLYDNEEQNRINIEQIKIQTRELFKDKSEDYIQGRIDEFLTLKHQTEIEERNEFSELLNAVLINKKKAGIIIRKKDKKIDVTIYTEKDVLKDAGMKNEIPFSHLYISLDEIFVELGISDHFKHQDILSDEEINSINVIRKIIKSNQTKSFKANLKNKGISQIDIELKTPKDNKEVEKYKLKLGDNLNFETKVFKGKPNLFNFHYNIILDKKP